MNEKCGATGKVRFETKQAAADFTAAKQRATKTHFCIFCSGWHLTRGKRHNGKKGGRC